MEEHEHSPVPKTDSQNLLVVPGRQKLQHKLSHKVPEDPNKGLPNASTKALLYSEPEKSNKEAQENRSSVCEVAYHL